MGEGVEMEKCDTHQIPEPMPSRSGARWGQERRLEFIDYRLAWDTQLNRSDLTTFFGISVPQASLDLAEYAKRAPGNLDYDPRTRAYRASPTFHAVFPASDVERYLGDLARAAQTPDVPYGSFLGDHPAVAYVPRPWRRADSDTVLAVSNAIRRHEALTISYQSLSQTGPKTRSVSPHAMVSDGFRWHFRAYCHTNDDYRDFVLARTRTANPTTRLGTNWSPWCSHRILIFRQRIAAWLSAITAWLTAHASSNAAKPWCFTS
jgi:hypothetical protein